MGRRRRGSLPRAARGGRARDDDDGEPKFCGRVQVVIIVPSVRYDAARERVPDGWKTVKPYLRVVPQPGRKG